MAIINDEEMLPEIISDLIENYNYTEKEAKEWAEENGSKIISAMWDEYSRFMEQEAVYKEQYGEDE